MSGGGGKVPENSKSRESDRNKAMNDKGSSTGVLCTPLKGLGFILDFL